MKTAEDYWFDYSQIGNSGHRIITEANFKAAIRQAQQDACDEQKEICAKQFIASADVTCRQSSAQERCREAYYPDIK